MITDEELQEWRADALNIKTMFSVERGTGKLSVFDDAQAWRIKRLIEEVQRLREELKILSHKCESLRTRVADFGYNLMGDNS